MKITVLNFMVAGLAIVTVATITGCADFQNEPIVYDEQFGQSVTQIKQAQILNPEAAQNPPVDPPKHLDGEAGVIIIDTYRQGFVPAQEVEDFSINIGTLGDDG